MLKKGAGKDNRILIIGLLIIFVIALVVMNFGRFTGNATKEKPSTILSVDPSSVNAGEYITINMIPGSEGAYNVYHICSAYNDVCQAHPKFSCSSFKCTRPVSDTYKTWSGWESGIYYAKAFDYSSKQYVKAYFTIE